MDQLSLFDTLLKDEVMPSKPPISAVKAQFICSEQKNWKDLFEGFDEIRVITFSSGLDFTADLLRLFKYAEVIFGCEDIIGNSMSTILSVETNFVEKITKSKVAKELSERLDNDTLQLYVSQKMKSHEKIYCLKADDGRVRVITGSANMSRTAFEGHQRENIIYFDEQDAYDYYIKVFSEFKKECSDNISKKVFKATMEDADYLRENPDEIPVCEKIKKERIIYLEPSDQQDEERIEFVTSTKNLENELKPMLPKPKKEGKTLIYTSEQLPTVKAKIKEVHENKKVKEKHLPKLHIDYELEKLDFNSNYYDFCPSKENVQNDIRCLDTFLSGLSYFHGDYKTAQNDFFRYLNWYFPSIFMPYLRYVAAKNDYEITTFPVVGIMYGDSNGGKSTFVQLLTKLMTGKKLPFNSNSDFTYTEVEKLRRGIEGIPLNFDDLDKTQFKTHSDKIIKEDEWGVADGFLNYPAISITTNKLPSLEAAISKRVIGIRIGVKIGKEEGLKCSKAIKESLKKASTALFSVYVARMLPKVKEMAERMKSGIEDNYEDIFINSSQTIVEIYKEYAEEVPDYVKELSFSDYFGDQVVGRGAIQKIRNAWKAEPKSFKVNKKENKLIYSYPENGNTYELQYIVDELPPKLNVQKSSRSLTMDLDVAEEFFGIKFKKSLLERIKDR